MAITGWVDQGTYLTNGQLSKNMRAQALPNYVFRQFVDKKDGLGAGRGDTVNFSKRLRIDTAGAALTETSSMTANTIKILKGTATVTEYGNKVEYTQKMETLSEISIKSEYIQGLKDDQVSVIDGAIATQFKTAKFKAVCTNTAGKATCINFTTNGTATSTAQNNVTLVNLRAIVDLAKTYIIPKMGSMYTLIGATNLVSQIYDDLQAVAQYAEPEFRYKDEVGKVYGTRVVEDNGTLDSSVGVSNYGEGVLFGEEAVAEIVALPEEIRFYEEEAGRFKYLMWYSILGFKKIWDRVADGQNATLTGLERIIHITSA